MLSISNKRLANGFTLLELLVVLAIIGILTGIGLASFTSAQVRARDSQRKADLKVIASVLEAYFQKNKEYPNSSSGSCGANVGWFCSATGDNWIPNFAPTYIKTLPKDRLNNGNLICQPSPENNTNASLTYAYRSTGAPPKQYLLVAKLENQNDGDAGKPVRFANSTLTYPRCFAIVSP